jgi:hypothetical protein
VEHTSDEWPGADEKNAATPSAFQNPVPKQPLNETGSAVALFFAQIKQIRVKCALKVVNDFVKLTR